MKAQKKSSNLNIERERERKAQRTVLNSIL